MNLSHLDATTLRKLLRTKKVSAQEITQALLTHIQTVDSEIQAFEYISEEAITAQHHTLEQFSNEALYGIPVGIKDIFNTYDMPTQMGSATWKNFTPGNDARVVHYIRESGGIVLGKTVTAEFAVHHQTKTRNPHDLSRSPGTSSSGSAAAVAANMVPIALGSQTAGSISRPASYCGVYGFKPSFGVIPRIGVLKTTDTLDNIGFLARSVNDLRLIFDVCRSKGENYEYVHKHIDTLSTQPSEQTKHYNIAIIEGHPQSHYLSDESKKAFQTWCQNLHDKNITITPITLDKRFERIYELHQIIYDKSLAYYFKKEFEDKTLLSPIMNELIIRGNSIDAALYHEAVAEQAKLTQEMHEYFKAYDVLITPTTADVAPVGLASCSDLPDSNLLWTFLGMPTISAPLLQAKDNLPQGILFISKKYDDNVLLNFLNYLRTSEIIPKEPYE